MTNSNVRMNAAELLLERGVRFTISGAPLPLRLLRLNRIHIRPFKAGTILEISRLMELYGLMELEIFSDANVKLADIAHVIAVAILNSKLRIRFFSQRVGKWLLWAVPAKVLTEIFLVIAQLNKVSDFMSITIYLGMIAQTMMSPKNLGQENTKGS